MDFIFERGEERKRGREIEKKEEREGGKERKREKERIDFLYDIRQFVNQLYNLISSLSKQSCISNSLLENIGTKHKTNYHMCIDL